MSRMFSIWVDADSCPGKVRNLIIKAAGKHHIPIFFVANKKIPLTVPPNYDKQLITTIQTPLEPDSADNYIVAHINPGDMTITRDIPLAARLVEKRILVLNDRGTLFTPENINEFLSLRNFNYELSLAGLKPQSTATYTMKDFNLFSNCFDRELHKKLKQYQTLSGN